jgi:pimeloyl-ACP methyl ester carboxylesterase
MIPTMPLLRTGTALRALLMLTVAAVVLRAPADVPATLKVGALTLQRCAAPARWCGTLPRPLDPSGKRPGTVAIYFEYYPHTTPGPTAGTFVPAEGGPGYPTSGSRDDYLALLAPLRATRDLLIMDYRGTGDSQALNCPQLQHAPALTVAGIGACGRYLGDSAPLYSMTLASDDLAALIQALAIGPIDLYGSSTGTFFAQVFALRHPTVVRSLVLDGAYPVRAPELAWWPNYAPAMRDRFNRACARDPACAQLPGDSLQHIAPALARLRARPFDASVRYGSGKTLRFKADASALASVMFSGWPPLTSLRETDAAARAFVAGDHQPLLRLMAETLTSLDSRDPTRDPRLFSSGYAAVVSCLDEPQIFDMSLPPAQRAVQWTEVIAARQRAHPDTYAPFTIDEYRGMPLDYTFIEQCIDWPVAPAAPLVVPPAQFPAMPVLVVSGDLDSLTGVADGAATAAQFPHAQQVVIANGLHVNALPRARSECAASLVRRFISDLTPGDESCAGTAPPVALLARFARHAAELPPARALPGNRAGPQELRAVSAAVLTCADVMARTSNNGAGRGSGLRNGDFTAASVADGYRLTLRSVRWTEDLAVSGRLDWPASGKARMHAQLQLAGQPGSGTLELDAPAAEAMGVARVRGTLDGIAVVAEVPAP